MFFNDARLIGPIVATVFALVGVYLCISLGMAAWVILAMAIAACLLVGYPRRLMALYFAWLTVSGMLEALLGRLVFVIWLDELLALLLLAVALATRIQTGKGVPEFKFFSRVLAGLGFLFAASFVANRPPLRPAVHFALAYFRFFLIFYYARRFADASFCRSFVRLFAAVFAVQVVMNFGWLTGLNPLPNEAIGRESVDFAYGTWLGVPTVAYLSVACICLCAAWFSAEQRAGRRLLALLVAAVAAGELWITYTVHAYLLAIVCLGAQVMLVSKKTSRKILVLCLTAIVLLLAWRPLERLVEEKRLRLSEQLTAQHLAWRWKGMLDGTKGRAYKDVILTVPKEHLRFPLLGAGPGNFSSAMGRLYRRPLAERYINYVLTVDSYREYYELSEGGSITGMPYSGVLALWGELGPFGAVLYLLPFFYAFWRVLALHRSGRYDDKVQNALAEAFVLLVPMFVFLNFLTDYFHNAFLQGGLWAMAAAVWTPGSVAQSDASDSSPGAE